MIQRPSVQCYKCESCGNASLELKKICPKCGASKIVPSASNGTGRIVDSTIVYFPPDDFKDIAPYTSVLVELDVGCRMFGIVSGERADLVPGSPVVAVAVDSDRGAIVFQLDQNAVVSAADSRTDSKA